MEAKSSTHDLNADDVKRVFSALKPLLLEEWPALDEAALEATGGELDALVEMIAAHADRPRVVVKRLVLELAALASRGAPSKGASSSPRIDELMAAVHRLEVFATEEAQKVSSKLVPKAEAKVKENIWVSLLFALGFGLILGLFLNGGRRGGRNG